MCLSKHSSGDAVAVEQEKKSLQPGTVAPTAVQAVAGAASCLVAEVAAGLKFRPPGAPAGAWPHTPWWHCTLHDPYERINVWSHFLPAVAFFLMGLAAACQLVPGSVPLAIFGVCAAVTHFFSSLTHVWPDSHSLEKLDHIGIVSLIIGTPVTALMAREHGHLPLGMLAATGAMVGAAFLRPLPRVLGFFAGVAAIVVAYGRIIVDANLGLQLALYAAGGASFLRNGGHDRLAGFSDHHFLHYFVTAACCLHVRYILAAMAAPALPM